MTIDDVEPLLGVFGDPVVMASFAVEPFDLPPMRRWVERNLAHQEQWGYGLWTIVRRDTGAVIGDCGLEWQDVGGQLSPELGYDLRSDHWGHGYATEAATAVRDHAFATLGLDHLVSVIRSGNARSRAVAGRVGMTHRSTIHRAGVDYLVYRIDRPGAGAQPD
jgi:[ribosomal protein S5]-alanine N-acetyltransferase